MRGSTRASTSSAASSRGERVSHDGHVRVDEARVWSRPATPPPLLGAAVGADTAAWVAGWADGLATVAQSPDALREVVDEYRDHGGRGPTVLQVHVSLAPTDAEALAIAKDQWRNGLVSPPECWDIEQPEEFDEAAGEPEDEEIREAVLISADAGELAHRIAGLVRIGFDRVYIHHVGKDQERFLRRAEAELLPRLREAS